MKDEVHSSCRSNQFETKLQNIFLSLKSQWCSNLSIKCVKEKMKEQNEVFLHPYCLIYSRTTFCGRRHISDRITIWWEITAVPIKLVTRTRCLPWNTKRDHKYCQILLNMNHFTLGNVNISIELNFPNVHAVWMSKGKVANPWTALVS